MNFIDPISVLAIGLFFIIYFSIHKFGGSQALLAGYCAYASLAIYSIWFPPGVIFVLAHAAISRLCSGILHRSHSRMLLAFLISISLLILIFVKYSGFFMIDLLGQKKSPTSIFLPLGLSFYTLSITGYYIDLFRGKTGPLGKFSEHLYFICAWPVIASGPILRAGNFTSSIRGRERVTDSTVALSLVLIASGIIKKMLIADNIGSYLQWNILFDVTKMNFIEAWVTVAGLGIQLYADFSGYSDMAIGFMLLMGIKLPANFNYPYLAESLSDFWRRWHISLSTWFRDYLYIPLGGDRKGRIRICLNYLIVFALSGLWHGAAFHYICWGLYHGAVLSFERTFRKSYMRINRYIRIAATFFIVTAGWNFFWFDLKTSKILLKKMFFMERGIKFSMISNYYCAPVVLLFAYFIIEHLVKFYTVDERGGLVLNIRRHAVILLCLLLVLAFIFSGRELSFIYFIF